MKGEAEPELGDGGGRVGRVNFAPEIFGVKLDSLGAAAHRIGSRFFGLPSRQTIQSLLFALGEPEAVTVQL